MPHAVDHLAILDRHATWRGARNTFSGFAPERTAHIVVDMQNGFLQESAPVEVPQARSIVDNINRISRAMRAVGGHNIFLRLTTGGKDGPEWPVVAQKMGAFAQSFSSAFAAGSHFWQIWPGIEVGEGEPVIDKGRFSGLTPGTSTLHDHLQSRGVDTLIITGTLTNCCCESTARDAMQLNYRVLMVADANAALSDEEHAAALNTMAFVFADLYDTEQLVALFNTR